MRSCNLQFSNFQTHIKDKYLEHFLRNYPHVNARRPHWWRLTSQHWVGWWLGAIKQAITWANADPELCRHMASLGHNADILLPAMEVMFLLVLFLLTVSCYITSAKMCELWAVFFGCILPNIPLTFSWGLSEEVYQWYHDWLHQRLLETQPWSTKCTAKKNYWNGHYQEKNIP